MTGNNPGWMERRDLVETAKPVLNARTCTVETEKPAIHDDIACEEHAVAFDKNHRVSVGMGSAVPQKAGAHAAQIQSLFGIEDFVGAPELRILHKLGHPGRSSREIGLNAEFFDVLLLRTGPDDLCSRRKGGFAKNMFGMKVRPDYIDVRV